MSLYATAPAWAVWLALGLWGAALVAIAVLLVLARRLWRQLAPTLALLLPMFAGGHGAQGDPATPVHDSGLLGHETPAGGDPSDAAREVVDAEFSDYA